MLSIREARDSVMSVSGERDCRGGLENITSGRPSAACFPVGEGRAVVP